MLLFWQIEKLGFLILLLAISIVVKLFCFIFNILAKSFPFILFCAIYSIYFVWYALVRVFYVISSVLPKKTLVLKACYAACQHLYGWGGALVRLLPIWKSAPKVNPAVGLWSPPASYMRASPLRTGLFERYLKVNWKDDIFAVCGAPQQQLVWWNSTPSEGATSLPPMDEFNTLTEVFELIVAAAEKRTENTAGASAAKTAKTKKAAAPPPPQTTLTAAKNEKKKRKKKAKLDEVKTDELTKPKPSRAVPSDDSGRFPRPSPAVLAATADWHEYVTAVLGSGQLLHNQVLGGALHIGWMVLTMEDWIPRLAHIDPDRMASVRRNCNKAREFLDSAKKALAVEGDASTVSLRKERDKLSGRISTVHQVLRDLSVPRCYPGLTLAQSQAADLGRIYNQVRQALRGVLLRLLPAVFQYSAAEAVDGEPRTVYPDFSRTRYVLRKGLTLSVSPVPLEPAALQGALLAASDWYPELVRLPDLVLSHVRAQLRPGGVLAERLARPQPFRTDTEKQLEALDLTKPETFSAVERVLREVAELSDGGPTPRRPATLRPHTGQSLVDAYWSRLAAMVFVTDLLSALPVSRIIQRAISAYKVDHLNSLIDAVVDLQIVQWRWLYPRTELELPRRPAFAQAATAHLMTLHLDHVDTLLRDTHGGLQVLCDGVKSRCRLDGQDPDKKLWHMVHFRGDACESAGAGFGHCSDCRDHAFDVANRYILRGMNQLLRLELKSGVELEKSVEFIHVVPFFLIVSENYKAERTKTAAMIVEKMFEDIMNAAKSQGGSDILHRAVKDITGPGPHNQFPEPRQLGYREANTREFMMTACHGLATRIIVHVHKAEMEMDLAVVMKTLKMAADTLSLTRAGGDESVTYQLPRPPRQLLVLGHDWPALLAAADAQVTDWRQCVQSAELAAAALTADGRPPPDAVGTEMCTARSGGQRPPRTACLHSGTTRLLCTVLHTLRNIRFVEHVVTSLEPGADITVHMTMLNVLREGWLPYLLAADRLLFRNSVSAVRRPHEETIVVTDGWLDTQLNQLYKRRPKMGNGKMLRTDRGSWTVTTTLRPDITLCRTISWSQACDLHMEMMKSLITSLWYSRVLLPPVVQDGCEAHPVPLSLLEQVETGAVLLLAAFLDYRDGRSARYLVDVSELGPEVARALDLHGWLVTVYHMICTGPEAKRHPEVKATELLQQRTQQALSVYERPLRTGSLLEFLALRQAHAEPLRWLVRAHLQRSEPTHEALLSRVNKAAPPLTLLPISELRSQAGRDRALPMEWMVRLQQLRRVLLSMTSPALLDATLVSLDYQLECSADQLTHLPTFDGPTDMSDTELFTAGCEVDAEALCNHVFDLGSQILKMQTDVKTFHYRTQDDHIYPNRSFFMKPFAADQFGLPRVVNVKKQPLPRGTGQTPSDSAVTGIQDEKETTGIQPAAIDSLTKELESLLLSTDHLSDIPEEPLEPALLDQAGQYAAQLSDGVQRLPDGRLKSSSRRLLHCVQQAVSPQTETDANRGKTRPIAGSEMSVVDTCLSALSSVLSQQGMAVTRPAAAAAAPETQVQGKKLSQKLRVCSFCDRPEEAAGAFELCSLCVTGGEAEPRAYCGKPCQTDDWEMGHWEEHN